MRGHGLIEVINFFLLCPPSFPSSFPIIPEVRKDPHNPCANWSTKTERDRDRLRQKKTERERDRERQRQRETEKDRDRVKVCNTRACNKKIAESREIF